MNGSNIVLKTENLRKDLKAGEVIVHALRGVSMEVQRGEFLGIIGPSGSGKSTLLGLIGGLDTPTDGSIYIDGVDITAMNERELTRIRNEKIGFVFQSFNLIPTLTALENVALPIQFSRQRVRNPKKRAEEILDMLGLADRMHHRPTQLSGGQQQRVAIARALANNPPLLLADEPTGNLDTASSSVVLDTLHEIREKTDTTIIVVTHDMDVASQVDHLITLVDGLIVDEVNSNAQAQQSAQNVLKQGSNGQSPTVVPQGVEVAGLEDTALAHAVQLIMNNRIDEAREALQDMTGHQTARDWLARLDELAP